MSDEKKCCEKPDRLTGTPKDCSAEQIKECHGSVKEHPCIQKDCTPEQTKECHGNTDGTS